MAPVDDFPSWLKKRKESWRSTYKVHKHENDILGDGDDDIYIDRELCDVSQDFWTHQGFQSFNEWLQQRKERWKIGYKVYRHKRQKIQQECEEVVHLNDPSVSGFNHWLRIRKNQWKVMRRKRQRQREEVGEEVMDIDTAKEQASALSSPGEACISTCKSPIFSPHHDSGDRRKRLKVSVDIDMACIDAILEEEERQRKARAERPPVDISFLFDSDKMCPDDVVVHCFEFLDRKEHSKLLCINKETSTSLKTREEVWRQLCPSHWILRK